MKLVLSPSVAASIAFAVQLFFAPFAAQAGSISFNNDQVDLSGGGFGNILQILVVQAQGNDTTEYGSVTRSGGSDVTSGNTTNQAQTISVADLATKGIVSTSTFGLIFNINEDVGSDVVLHDFTMTFTDDTGTSLFADITYSPPGGGITLDEVANGQGGSGWLFFVNLTPSEESTFFGTASNRVGMYITSDNAIEMVSNGAEEFHVFQIPEPAAFATAIIALCAVAPLTRRTRKRG